MKSNLKVIELYKVKNKKPKYRAKKEVGITPGGNIEKRVDIVSRNGQVVATCKTMRMASDLIEGKELLDRMRAQK